MECDLNTLRLELPRACKICWYFQLFSWVQRVGWTGIVVSSLTVAFAQAAAALAKFFHNQTVSNENRDFLSNRSKAIAIVLKPLAVALPIIGWILAISNLLGGSALDLLPSSHCHACLSRHKKSSTLDYCFRMSGCPVTHHDISTQL